MENDAESIISSEEKKEALRRSRGYFKISGVLYGAFDEDSTNEAVISGITIGILGKFQSQTLISGISGDFESGDLPEGKYTLSFRDPSQKYSHSPIKLNLLKDIYLPVHMLLPGADKKGRRGSNLRSALSGIVLNRKKKPIPGAIITINSLTIEKKGQNILGKALSKIFPRFIKGQEKPVSINLTTNILGMFSLGRSVPKGSYIVRCSDKSGQYRFSSKFIVIRDKSFPFIVFIGYSSSDLEELRKKLEEEKEAQEKEKLERAAQEKLEKEKLEKEMGEFPQVQKQPESIPNQKVGSVRQVFIRTNYLRPLSNVAGRSSSFALRGTGRIISGGLSNATNAINYLAQVIRAGSIAARALAVLGSTPVGWVVGAAIAVALIIILLVLFFMRGSPSFPSELGEAATIGGGDVISKSLVGCPVPGGSVSTPSYQADPVNGHCGTTYTAAGFYCMTNSRRAKSIDVPSNENIILPMIEGKSVSWTFVNRYSLNSTDCSNPVNGSCGQGLVFVNYLDAGKNWTLFLDHVGFSGLMPSQSYLSGTIVGTGAIDHFHISIGKDVPEPETAPAGSTDTRPGWLAADIEAGMCTNNVPPQSGVCSVGTLYCSPAYLNAFFNDPVAADKASVICQRESGGCPGAYGAGAWGSQSCDNLLSIERRNQCEAQLFNPVENIKKAVEIYKSWGSFKPWSAAAVC